MKKTMIAGAGVVALGLAVLPFAGVFATASHTDTVTVNVPLSCSMSVSGAEIADGGSSAGATIAIGNATVGTAQKKDGTKMTVSCNKRGWTISAVGDGGTSMTTTNGGTPISTLAGETTDASNWGFRIKTLTGGVSAAIATTPFDYSTFQAVPGSATVVVSDNTNNYTSNVTTEITPEYRVFVKSGQAQGTYTGKVKYVFTQPSA